MARHRKQVFQVVLFPHRRGAHPIMLADQFEIRPRDQEPAVIAKLVKKYAPEADPSKLVIALVEDHRHHLPEGSVELVNRISGKRLLALRAL
jgi:hypothetical protein